MSTREDIPMTRPPAPEQDRLPQPDPGLPLSGDYLSMSAQWAAPPEEGGVPAYNAGPPPKGTKLPPFLAKSDLWGADAQNAYQTHAYELAAKIPTVLHQQPCYCYCDRMGHNSLHSCFENTHGAQCATCLKELYYSYQQHQERQDRGANPRRNHSRVSGSRSICCRLHRSN